MKKLVADWEDKQGVLKKHTVNKSLTDEEKKKFIELWNQSGKLTLYERTPTREQIIEILELYNNFLYKEDPDYDFRIFLAKELDQFLLKYYPKL